MNAKDAMKNGSPREADTTWIKTRLAARGLTQRALSEILEIHPSNMSHLLRAHGETALPKYFVLAEALGVSFEELLRRLGYTLPEGDRVRLIGSVQSDGSVKTAPAGKFVVTGPVAEAVGALHFGFSELDQAVLYIGSPSAAEMCINSTVLVEDSLGSRVRVLRRATSREQGLFSLHPALGTSAQVEDEIPLRYVQKAVWMRF